MKEAKLMSPKSMRKLILPKIHNGQHTGIKKYRGKAREVLARSEIDRNAEQTVENYS